MSEFWEKVDTLKKELDFSKEVETKPNKFSFL